MGRRHLGGCGDYLGDRVRANMAWMRYDTPHVTTCGVPRK